ncbi:MAG: FecR domain-containing protein [Cyclobacteriaceae bacterium]
MTTKEFYRLAKKYETGKCSDEENKLFEKFYHQFNEDGLKWDLKEDDDKKQIQEEIYKNIQSHIGNSRAKKTNQFNSVMLKIAAVFVVIAGVAWMIYSYNYESHVAPLTDMVSDEQLVKENPNGVKTRIKLPDGTKVWLNSGSKISYPRTFSQNIRKVELEGEAFFEVHRDTSKPFIVNARNVETRVLGTSFNVMAYEKRNVAITVATGKVQVSSFDNESLKKSTIDLIPDQQATFDLTTGNINVNKIDATRFSAWTEGKLIFDEMKMDEVVQNLERWYGVKVFVQSEAIKNCTISIEYANETLINVLDGFKYIFNIDYELIDEKKIILKGNGCSN